MKSFLQINPKYKKLSYNFSQNKVLSTEVLKNHLDLSKDPTNNIN
jgi:hypothetical protein